jgi:hypothetical protein
MLAEAARWAASASRPLGGDGPELSQGGSRSIIANV